MSSEDTNLATAPEGKPIPFKPEAFVETVDNGEKVPPTSRKDCQRVGGHGGADGSRVYVASTTGKRICEICGHRLL